MRHTVRTILVDPHHTVLQAVQQAGVDAQEVAPLAEPQGREDIAVLDARAHRRGPAAALALDLRSRLRPPLAILGAAETASPPTMGAPLREQTQRGFDAWIAIDAPPQALASQIERAARTAVIRDELAARRETAATMRLKAVRAGAQQRLEILFIGPPHPVYLELDRWAKAHDGRLSAAFSSFAGFDHLHDEAFSAVVINGAADWSSALAMCAALRRNARLHHLPALALCAEADAGATRAALLKGATAAHHLAQPDQLGCALAWLWEAIRVERMRADAEAGLHAFRDQMGDGRTGLLHQAAFASHLETLAARHHEAERPLSLIAIAVEAAFGARQNSIAPLDRAAFEAAGLAARLVRASDTGVFMEERRIILIAQPATGRIGARRTAERICAVADCTTFASDDAGAAPLALSQNVVELQPGESAAALLRRALRPLDQESLSA